MKITVYTINDCKFSQTEKEYFKKNNVEFEEKNLETNRDFLTEMLAVSNNFAGTPVTKIEKDSGESVVLKGFTQEEFDKVLGITPSTTAQPAQTAAVAATSPEVTQDSPAEADVQPLAVPEAQPTETQEAEVQPAPAADVAPEAAPAPVVPPAVESLSQDDSSEVTPSPTNEVTAPEPIAPIAPKADDTIGPISLAGDTNATTPTTPGTEVSAQGEATANTETPVAQPTEVNASQQPEMTPQPPADALNSVLQNLQNQVKSEVPDQEEQKQ